MNTLIEKLDLSGRTGSVVALAANVVLLLALIWGDTSHIVMALAFALLLHSTMGCLTRAELRNLKNAG